jgi:uncharacterized membrane protein YccC
LLAFGADAKPVDVGPICIAGIIAMLAAVLSRWLICRFREADSVSSRLAVRAPASVAAPPSHSAALLHGIQTSTAALVVVVLNNFFVLTESAWAITACVYVMTASMAETVKRARHRIFGTLVGVPVALLCMPIAAHTPVLTWALAALAMVVYMVALPRRYDVACGAFAFVLVVTLEIGGQHSVFILLARIWETLLGATLGVAVALLAWLAYSGATRQRHHLNPS